MTRRDPPGADYYDYVYDTENRLTQARKNNSVVADLTYDGDGQRVNTSTFQCLTFYGD
jgi:YD repeat-containing protein